MRALSVARGASAALVLAASLWPTSSASATTDAGPDIPFVESAIAAISAHAEWRVVQGRQVTRYAAWGVRFAAPEYYSEVRTDVGVLRRRCSLRVDRAGGCNFRPKDGVDSEIDFLWDPTLSEINLTFKYRGQMHSVTWLGQGEHQVRPNAEPVPPFVALGATVSRSATASGTIYGDSVGRKGLIQEETHIWQGGHVWNWIPVSGSG